MAYAWQQQPGDERATRRQVLAVLADGSMLRIDLQRTIFGSTFVGSYTLLDALRWCAQHRYVERAGSRRWRLTEAGRNALDLADMLDVGGAA